MSIYMYLLLLMLNTQVSDYTVSLNGKAVNDENCKLLLIDKNGLVSETYAIKSFMICLKEGGKPSSKANWYTNAGNTISEDFRSTVLNHLFHGNYQLTIKDIICGPISEDNTDIHHFRLKEVQMDIQL